MTVGATLLVRRWWVRKSLARWLALLTVLLMVQPSGLLIAKPLEIQWAKLLDLQTVLRSGEQLVL